MEDQGRRMEVPKQKITHTKKAPKRITQLTVMIMGRVGKVRAFKISTRFVLGATLFLLLYIPLSIFIINRHIDLNYVSSSQSKKIKRLESELSKGKRNFYRSKQHVALLEDYIQRLEKQKESGDQQENEEILEKKSAGRGFEARPLVREKRKTSEDIVDITDLVIQKDGPKMTVNFKLVNLQSEENAVGGYIHIIAKGKKADAPHEWTYPRVGVRDGVPENYRRGQLFLIQRFKHIYGKFNLNSGSEQPSSIRVLVYDQAGVLLLEEEFEVRNAS